MPVPRRPGDTPQAPGRTPLRGVPPSRGPASCSATCVPPARPCEAPAREAIIDVHTHFVPASVVAAARRGRGFDVDMAAGPLADQLAGTGLAPADAELIAGRNAAALFGVPG